MKRCVVIALIALVLIPASIAAQDDPADVMDVTVPADAIGDGWSLASNEEGGSNPWDQKLIYYGPAGASVVIEVYEFVGTLSGITMTWQFVDLRWRDQSRMPERADFFENWPYPEGCSDARRAEGNDADNGQRVGHSLYGSVDDLIAIIVRTEGPVNDKTGALATDYIAGLYFAALSAQ